MSQNLNMEQLFDINEMNTSQVRNNEQNKLAVEMLKKQLVKAYEQLQQYKQRQKNFYQTSQSFESKNLEYEYKNQICQIKKQFLEEKRNWINKNNTLEQENQQLKEQLKQQRSSNNAIVLQLQDKAECFLKQIGDLQLKGQKVVEQKNELMKQKQQLAEQSYVLKSKLAEMTFEYNLSRQQIKNLMIQIQKYVNEINQNKNIISENLSKINLLQIDLSSTNKELQDLKNINKLYQTQKSKLMQTITNLPSKIQYLKLEQQKLKLQNDLIKKQNILKQFNLKKVQDEQAYDKSLKDIQFLNNIIEQKNIEIERMNVKLKESPTVTQINELKKRLKQQKTEYQATIKVSKQKISEIQSGRQKTIQDIHYFINLVKQKDQQIQLYKANQQKLRLSITEKQQLLPKINYQAQISQLNNQLKEKVQQNNKLIVKYNQQNKRIETNKKYYEQQNNKKTSIINELNQVINQLKNQKLKSINKFQQQNKKVIQLLEKNDEQKQLLLTNNDKYQQQIDSKQISIRDLQNKLRMKQEEIIKLKKNIELTGEQNKIKKYELKTYNLTTTAEKKQINQLKVNISKLSTQNIELKEIINNLNNQLEKVRNDYEILQKQYIQKSENDQSRNQKIIKQKLEYENNIMRSSITKSQQNIQKLTKELQFMKQQQNKLKIQKISLTQNLKYYTQLNESVNKLNSTLQLQLSKCHQQIKNKQVYTKTNHESLSIELNSKYEQISRLNYEKSQLLTQYQTYKRTNKYLIDNSDKKLKDKEQNFKSEIKKLTDKIMRLQQQKVECQSTRNQLRQQISYIKQSQANQIKILKQQIDLKYKVKQNEIKNLTISLNKQKQKNNELNDKLIGSQNNEKILQYEKQKLIQNNNVMKSVEEKLINDINTLKLQISKLSYNNKQKFNNFEQEIIGIRFENQRLNQHLAFLEQQINQRQNKLKNYHEQLQQIKLQLNNRINYQNQIEQENKELKYQKRQLESQLNKNEENYLKTIKKLTNEVSELKNEKKTNNNYNIQIKKLQQELYKQTNEKSEQKNKIQRQLKELKQQTQLLKEKIEIMKLEKESLVEREKKITFQNKQINLRFEQVNKTLNSRTENYNNLQKQYYQIKQKYYNQISRLQSELQTMNGKLEEFRKQQALPKRFEEQQSIKLKRLSQKLCEVENTYKQNVQKFKNEQYKMNLQYQKILSEKSKLQYEFTIYKNNPNNRQNELLKQYAQKIEVISRQQDQIKDFIVELKRECQQLKQQNFILNQLNTELNSKIKKYEMKSNNNQQIDKIKIQLNSLYNLNQKLNCLLVEKQSEIDKYKLNQKRISESIVSKVITYDNSQVNHSNSYGYMIPSKESRRVNNNEYLEQIESKIKNVKYENNKLRNQMSKKYY